MLGLTVVPFCDAQPLVVNSVDVIKQGIRCDAWLYSWFLWVTSFTCKWNQLLVYGFLYNYKCRYTHLCEYVYLAGTGTMM